MRRLALLTLLACAPATPVPPESPEMPAEGLVIVPVAGAALDERPYFHDFGRRPYGDHLEHVFAFENREGRPVTIKKVDASCGCTLPEISYLDASGARILGAPSSTAGAVLELPPGAVGELRVRLKTSDVTVMNRDKLAMVRMISDSAVTPFLTFELHVVVELLFQATPKTILIENVPENGGKSGISEIIRATADSPAQILGIERAEPPLIAELEVAQRFEETLWTLIAKVPPGASKGSIVGDIVLRTTDSTGAGDTGRFVVPVRAQVVDDVVVEPPLVAFGDFPSAEGATRSATVTALLPGQRILVAGTRVEGPASAILSASATPLDPDAAGRSVRWRLDLTVRPGAPEGVVSGLVFLDLDEGGPVRLQVSARPRP